VVLVADEVAECGPQDDRPDHPLGVALGRHVENADAREPLTINCDERVPEELVHAADHQHRSAIFSQSPQDPGIVDQIVLDPSLPAVLAATPENQMSVGREVVAWVVTTDDGFVPVPAKSTGQGSCVAQVAVDAHLARVDVNDLDPTLAGAHAGSSPKFASPYRAARLRRRAIIAV
jgi:hypothetical protein